jgi:hypothetical protein
MKFIRRVLGAWLHRAGLVMGAVQPARRGPKLAHADVARSGLTAADFAALGW